MGQQRLAVYAVLGLSLATAGGCASGGGSRGRIDPQTQSLAPVAWSAPRGVVIYVDGAGGGGPIFGGAADVELGLRQAGFKGDFVEHTWQTGFGAIADECSNLEYKRGKAAGLTARIRAIRAAQPGTPIHLVAASAGTAIAVFALEGLHADERVAKLALLSSALSAEYDLSKALDHVEVEAIAFASASDGLLQVAIPVLGSADRRDVGKRVAGLVGFERPKLSETERFAKYLKLRTIHWNESMVRVGHAGGHTDCKNPTFVARFLAPLLRG